VLKLTLASMIIAGTTGMALAADPSPKPIPAPIAEKLAEPHPRQMSGPVRIRFRHLSGINAALDDSDAIIVREATLDGKTRGKKDD